jgi:hypothetical protein
MALADSLSRISYSLNAPAWTTRAPRCGPRSLRSLWSLLRRASSSTLPRSFPPNSASFLPNRFLRCRSGTPRTISSRHERRDSARHVESLPRRSLRKRTDTRGGGAIIEPAWGNNRILVDRKGEPRWRSPPTTPIRLQGGYVAERAPNEARAFSLQLILYPRRSLRTLAPEITRCNKISQTDNTGCDAYMRTYSAAFPRT